MLIACIRRDFVEILGAFFPFMLMSGKIKLSIRLAGIAPGNTRGFNGTLCFGVFPIGEMSESFPTSCKIAHSTQPGKIFFSPLQTHLNNNFNVVQI